jgi:hypothetical protein
VAEQAGRKGGRSSLHPESVQAEFSRESALKWYTKILASINTRVPCAKSVSEDVTILQVGIQEKGQCQ